MYVVSPPIPVRANVANETPTTCSTFFLGRVGLFVSFTAFSVTCELAGTESTNIVNGTSFAFV